MENARCWHVNSPFEPEASKTNKSAGGDTSTSKKEKK